MFKRIYFMNQIIKLKIFGKNMLTAECEKKNQKE